jgi:hypothetical protein
MKGLVDTSISNINFAKESATQSIDDMTNASKTHRRDRGHR